MNHGDATVGGSRPLTGREAALADIAERRRRDPYWDHRTDPTYLGPHPTFVPLMRGAEFDRCMAVRVARGEVRANPYTPQATESTAQQPTPRPRLPVRAALPFGERIRELRHALGWTQREIALAIRRQPALDYPLRTGSVRPDPGRAVAGAAAAGVSLYASA